MVWGFFPPSVLTLLPLSSSAQTHIMGPPCCWRGWGAWVLRKTPIQSTAVTVRGYDEEDTHLWCVCTSGDGCRHLVGPRTKLLKTVVMTSSDKWFCWLVVINCDTGASSLSWTCWDGTWIFWEWWQNDQLINQSNLCWLSYFCLDTPQPHQYAHSYHELILWYTHIPLWERNTISFSYSP